MACMRKQKSHHGAFSLILTYTTADCEVSTRVISKPWLPNPESKFLRYTTVEGDVYDGDYVDNQPHGKGRKLFASGANYNGEWKRGKEHGFGRWESGMGDVYEGGFRDGKPHGEGRFSSQNGDLYVGGWFAGKQHGRGAYFGKDGYVYDGEWAQGKVKCDRSRTNVEVRVERLGSMIF